MIIVRAEPLLRVQDVQIELMKGIGSVGESINVKLKLLSSLEEVKIIEHYVRRLKSCNQVSRHFFALLILLHNSCKIRSVVPC